MMVAMMGAGLCAMPEAEASVTVNLGPEQSFTMGVGVRGQYMTADPSTPDDGSAAAASDLRIYMGGQIIKTVKATLNLERIRDGNWNVLDGILQIEPLKGLNLWLGRMLPGSDRSNLDGPYFLSTYAFPIVAQYPGMWSGRNDGATLWGKLAHDRFRYMAGIYKGHNWVDGGSGTGHNPLFAGRLEYNFLDPEPSPAYYTASTYYGKADILAIGLAGQYQVNGVGTASLKGDYKAWNIDGLFEKRIGRKARWGVYTLEAAYYQYHADGVKDVAPGFGNRNPDYGNIGGINSGTAFLVNTAYLIPWRVGWGRIQPLLRYQQFRYAHDLYGPGNPKTRQLDAGANYVLDGHNLRFTLDYARYTPAGAAQSNAFLLGMQLQY
nr:porin [Asaia sp. W19]